MKGLKPAHEEILQARGLDVEMLATRGLESLEKAGGEWIRIPFLKGGEIVNWKTRTIAKPGVEYDKRFYQEANAEKCFYNFDAITDPTLAKEPLIITEGEPDAWSLLQAGYVRTVSVPDGAPQEAAADVMRDRDVKYSFVFDALPLLRDVKEIILATDNDGPGHILRDELAQILGRARCKWMPYPKGCKDANETLIKYGADGLKKSYERASWMRLDGVYALSELPPADSRVAYPTGLCGNAIDDILKVRLGDLLVLTGIPNMGKSALLTDLCCHLNWNYGWPIASFSPEQEAQSEHRDNLRQWHARKSPDEMEAWEVEKADAWIEQAFRFIVSNDEDELSVEWFEEKAAAAIIRYGCKVVTIDPWNELDHIYPNGMTETDYTGLAVRRLKRFARRHNVLVIIAAHPKKMERMGDGSFKMPSTYDIAGSAHWFNKPDICVIVHRTRECSLIRTEKLKNHRTMGRPGERKVGLDRETGRFFAIKNEDGSLA